MKRPTGILTIAALFLVSAQHSAFYIFGGLYVALKDPNYSSLFWFQLDQRGFTFVASLIALTLVWKMKKSAIWGVGLVFVAALAPWLRARLEAKTVFYDPSTSDFFHSIVSIAPLATWTLGLFAIATYLVRLGKQGVLR